MLSLAGTEPGVALAPVSLDADPYLLNVANGTVDLHTGQLRPHDPADLLTKICGAAYHPDAEAPEFAEFLQRIQPDEGMREFLARLFGHALLGKVVEHVLAILYGAGSSRSRSSSPKTSETPNSPNGSRWKQTESSRGSSPDTKPGKTAASPNRSG